MDNAVSPHHYDGGTIIYAKTALQHLRSQFDQQYRSEISIRHDEANSYPNTPPLTLITPSTSSSVVACEVSGGCGDSSCQCSCLGQSDTDSVQIQGFESESGVLKPAISSGTHRLDPISERSEPSVKRCENSSLTPDQSVRGLTPGVTNLQTEHARPLSRLKNHIALSPPPTVDQDNSDFNESGDDEDGDDDNATDEGDYWSGQESDFEALILQAVGEDLELAAYLIPWLHKQYHSEVNANVRNKIAPWVQELSKCAAGTGSHDMAIDETPPSTVQSNDSPPNTRKRQRISGSTRAVRDMDRDEDEDEEEDEDNQDPRELGEHGGNGSSQSVRRLACPFFKKEPLKYCTQHGSTDNSNNQYRICPGPGFKNIQRLKEHIKRKHYPVQCERCYEIFPFNGSDRASGVRALQAHRQLIQPCERGDPTQQEGISEAQCADLDKKRNQKKSHLTSSVEKYWEIWDILFPGVLRPASPWYDQSSPNRRAVRSPQEMRFGEIFSRILTHHVDQQNIRFEPGSENDMRSRVQNLGEKAFSVFLGVERLPSSTNTSSSRSVLRPNSHDSLLSGSYDNITDFQRSRAWSSSTPSRSSIARIQPFVDGQGSPPANNSLIAARRPQYLNNNNLQMTPQNFGGHMTGSPNLQPGVPAFQLGLHSNIPFPSSSFNNNAGSHSFNAGHQYMYDVAFASANPGFNNDNPANGYAPSNTQDLTQDWDQVSAPRRTDYNGS